MSVAQSTYIPLVGIGPPVRLPLQPTTPHWETPSMAVRAIFAPVCRRRTARRLPYQIQTMVGRAVFYSTISIDDINYLLTYDSYVPLYDRFHRGEWITRVNGGEGALDTPGPPPPHSPK